MIKPKLELKKQSDSQLLVSSTAIKNAMTTNAAEFPSSAAKVTLLGTKVTSFSAAIQAVVDAKAALEALVAARNNVRVEIEDVLRLLAGDVEEVAQGDVEIIHDAAMQASNEPTPVVLGQVTDLQVTQSANVGELKARWKPEPGALVYQVQISTDAGAPVNWIDKDMPGAAKCSLNHDLVSASKVWIRVRARASKVVGPWSDAVQKTVP